MLRVVVGWLGARGRLEWLLGLEVLRDRLYVLKQSVSRFFFVYRRIYYIKYIKKEEKRKEKER